MTGPRTGAAAVKLREFERRAHRVFQRIPEEYREGVDGLTVSPEALPHPTLPDIYTLGMCITEPYPSDWVGPETMRSIVVLYHGSFRELARLDPDFDWEEQIWETLTHELRHHLEYLAGEWGLEGVDYALDETFKRERGVAFDPWYYQRGDEVADGVYRVEQDVYVEQLRPPAADDRAEAIRFQWHGDDFVVPAPEELGDVHFVQIRGVDTGPGILELVLVRRKSWWERVKDLLAGRSLRVRESEAWARPLREAPAEMDDPVRERSREEGGSPGSAPPPA